MSRSLYTVSPHAYISLYDDIKDVTISDYILQCELDNKIYYYPAGRPLESKEMYAAALNHMTDNKYNIKVIDIINK